MTRTPPLLPSTSATLLLIAWSSVLLLSSAAHAARPIPVHHQETAPTGPTHWATIPYTRGLLVEVTRDLTLRGIAIYADFDASETCEARVYDDAGVLRAGGPAQPGEGTGSGASLEWWSLPIDTELFAGETVTLAVYCTSTSTTTYYPHRDPPAAQLDAVGYFIDIRNRSFLGDGHPTLTNTWWGDWRLEVEQHGLTDQYQTASPTGTMANSRGAILTTTREHLITGIDLYVDLDIGDTCKPQVFDAGGTMIAEGTVADGDGAGLHWYRSDLAIRLAPGATYTVAMYCAQVTTYGSHWNADSTYTLLDDAIAVHGRSGGGDGIMPASINAITPVMQMREGEIELVNRDGITPPSTTPWSNRTWGWRFTPEVFLLLEGIEVLSERDSGTAYARVYDTATATLLATSASPLPLSDDLEWRLAALPNVALLPGRSYTVGIYYLAGTTSAPFQPGTAGTYARPGVLQDVAFCGSPPATDAMPTSCSFNQRVERLIVSAPEPAFGLSLAVLVLATALVARGPSLGARRSGSG